MTTLSITKATVTVGLGCDRISLRFESETAPLPFYGEESKSACFECLSGEGAKWVRDNLKIEPEIIDLNMLRKQVDDRG